MSSFLEILKNDKLKVTKAIEGLTYLISTAEHDEFFGAPTEEQVEALKESLKLAEAHLDDINEAIKDEEKEK